MLPFEQLVPVAPRHATARAAFHALEDRIFLAAHVV
jgi:hypothetical protein